MCRSGLSVFAVVILLGFQSGCGGSPSPKLLVVQGVITVEGNPVNEGGIELHPNDANTKASYSDGVISDGKYTASAAAGNYKVVVVPILAEESAALAYDPKYTDRNKTPLTIQVTDKPASGAYDLKLTK